MIEDDWFWMGIQRWVANEDWFKKSAPVASSADIIWDQLQQQVAVCQACVLHKTRMRTVFGVGDRQAACLVIGEAPGADEDRQGEPFVGRAGQLLDAILWAVGIERSAVYITNILKCRPPQNREPFAEEVAACQHFLQAQIRLIQPQMIVAVGKVPALNLVKTHEKTLGRLRGQVYSYQWDEAIPVYITYHPAYLLRSPQEKRKAWQDWLAIRDQLSTILFKQQV